MAKIQEQTNNKLILDACCGGRMFWFDKENPNTIYIDKRTEKKGCIKQWKNFNVKPDIVMDFRKMDFPDKSFKLVVFDPPHLIKLGDKSLMKKKYGRLKSNWREDLKKGFEECWRVLDDNGVLIFKWNNRDISQKEVLSLFPVRPLFGQVGINRCTSKTLWFVFMKIINKQVKI
jgi:SAM-dependent methyltransferase